MKPYFRSKGITLYVGDSLSVLRTMPDQSVQMCVTSPPYWGLRDYGVKGQLGLEATPELYVSRLVDLFGEVRRVLRDDGTLWLNLGDSYAGGGNNRGGNPSERSCKQASNRGGYGQIATPVPIDLKPKDLVGIPWRVAFALQADGWYLRSDIIWHKPNPMPESVTDRPTKAHEYMFLLAKSDRYFYDAAAVAEPAKFPEGSWGSTKKLECAEYRSFYGEGRRWTGGPTRNRRTVWSVSTKPFKGAHFATFPPKLIEPCILAGSGPGDVVLDPFSGAGTSGLVAQEHGRQYVGIELNREYADISIARLTTARTQAA